MDEFFHFFNVNASNNKSVICYVVVFFSWSMSGGTEPKLEPMLDFNTSAKTTESSKPHIFLFISRWFDISFKSRSTKST